MKRKKKSILSFLLTTFFVVLAVFLIYIWQAKNKKTNSKPVIICPTETISVSVESMKDYSSLLRDVTALDVEDGDITASVVVESVSQFVEEGHCIVTYAAFDSANNVTKLTRHLFLTDYEPPKFSISAPLAFNHASNFDPMKSVGAYDCIDGDISDRVKMTLVNPDDDISSVGSHLVEFKVTNSLGDVAVLEAEVDVYERTSTEIKLTPIIKLSNYVVYVDQYSYIDPNSVVEGISLNGSIYSLDEYQEAYQYGTLEINNLGVDFTVPGTYSVLYTCDYKGDYYGSVVLIVIVNEV